jgi:hypothetical protein
MKYINKLLKERTVGQRTADHGAQEEAEDAKKGKPKNKQTETEKNERASDDVGSQVSRRPRSGESPRTQVYTPRGRVSKGQRRRNHSDDQIATGKGSKAKKRAKKLVSHTVYQDMGYLMAESLGLVSEARKARNDFIAARDTTSLKDQAEKTGHSAGDLRAAGGSKTLADIAKADRERKKARDKKNK